ncbi:MAG: cytochrome c [Anaerolineae bacterium]|nr:cytochrome c [Anaerolineae bacterium]
MRYFGLVFIFLALILSGCSQNAAQSAGSGTSDPTAIVGDVTRGQTIFARGTNGAPACSSCHPVSSGGFALGPVMSGIAERAATRVEGLTAEQYLHQSIVDPAAHVVSGYRPIMYPGYAKVLSEQDIADVIAYLLTLK